VRRLATLPRPTTHAAATAVGSTVYVLGGRGATVGTPTSRIVAIDLPSGRVRAGGRLPARLSDLAAATLGGRVLVAGGRGATGAVDAVAELVPQAERAPRATRNVYAADGPNELTGAARLARLLVYVPNSQGDTVDVIDPSTYRVVRRFRVGGEPQHVVPAWDLKTLYVTNDTGNSLTTIDPRTGRPGRTIPRRRSLQHERVVGTLALRRLSSPQDVKLSPDGRVFYVADLLAGGVWLVDGDRLRVLGFLRTGTGAHGLYASRDARFLYVTNRSAGTISVIAFATRRIVHTWRIPGGSPDMGNVSADGKVLWLSGRYTSEVYAISTRDGRPLARIKVGPGPHALCVWPQPGRYSLGHTGILR
jgi:YVTN family beta-propeller protein